MSRDRERDDELVEAAQELALRFNLAKRNDRGELVDQGELSDEDDDEDDDLRDAIQGLFDEEDAAIEAFEGDVDLVLRYLRRVLSEGAPE